jgi:hypothetical protein
VRAKEGDRERLREIGDEELAGGRSPYGVQGGTTGALFGIFKYGKNMARFDMVSENFSNFFSWQNKGIETYELTLVGNAVRPLKHNSPTNITTCIETF